MQIDLLVDLAGVSLSGDAALTLYRAAQEGITNALRHGQADQLALSVQGGPDAATLTLTLTDNGRELAADWQQRPGHHGLRWLSERVEALGGSVRLHAADEHAVERAGATLHVNLPAAKGNTG